MYVLVYVLNMYMLCIRITGSVTIMVESMNKASAASDVCLFRPYLVYDNCGWEHEWS